MGEVNAVPNPENPKMRKFDAFVIGFASVFTGIAGCLVMFGEAVGQSFLKKPDKSSKQSGIDYFDGFKKDREALASDFGKIGGDFRRAIDQYVETHKGTANPSF